MMFIYRTAGISKSVNMYKLLVTSCSADRGKLTCNLQDLQMSQEIWPHDRCICICKNVAVMSRQIMITLLLYMYRDDHILANGAEPSCKLLKFNILCKNLRRNSIQWHVS